MNSTKQSKDLILSDGGTLQIRHIPDDKPCYTITYYTNKNNPGVVRTTFAESDLNTIINVFLSELKATVTHVKQFV